MSFTAFIFDVVTDTFYPARITIEDGVYKEITPISINENSLVDVKGLMIPGFIDAHIHIESSMLTPAQFAKIAVRHGTTGVVCDPHEIANVLGIEGIEAMIENAKHVPFNFYFVAPSCVPATPFETSGAVLDSSDIDYLLQKDEIVALGEMMNFPGVINGDEEVLKKLEAAKKYGKPIDGHAPMLSRENLDKYIKQGINTDHECSTILEALEKKVKGMKIMVRDGSSALDMENLFNISEGNSVLEYEGPMSALFRDIFEKSVSERTCARLFNAVLISWAFSCRYASLSCFTSDRICSAASPRSSDTASVRFESSSMVSPAQAEAVSTWLRRVSDPPARS